MTRFDAVGFGALNVDRLFRTNEIAKPEEESYITDCFETCGGSAANTIVGLARLGCETGFIGKTGTDPEGRKLVRDLKREGVNTQGVIRSSDGRSGTVIGFVDQRGRRALYINPGVNDQIDIGDINVDYAGDTGFLHLTSFVGERSLKAQVKLLEVLPENVRISFDPGLIYARLGLGKLKDLIKKIYVCMPNSNELTLLTGKSDYCAAASFLLQNGVKIVAVKLGESGCYVMDAKGGRIVPPFRVKTVDTTGAGDAFCAGFLYGLIHDKDIYACARLGNFVASRSVMMRGARAGLPKLEELGEIEARTI